MFSRIQAWNSYMIGLFIQKSHFHPYSIHSWFANGKTFCLLCLQVKIRKLTRDQLSSLVRFKTTSLNWISLVMKVDPSLTFLIFLVSTTTKYFPVCVPLVSYCDGLKSTICWWVVNANVFLQIQQSALRAEIYEKVSEGFLIFLEHFGMFGTFWKVFKVYDNI